MHIKTNNYYCEECGMELTHKGHLCQDCSREIRNHKFSFKNNAGGIPEKREIKPKKIKKSKRYSGRKRIIEDAD